MRYTLPEKISVSLYIFGWIIIICMNLFFIYWIYSWGISNGTKSFGSWGLNFILVFVLELMGTQILRILALRLIAMYTIEPQLFAIKRVLQHRATEVIEYNNMEAIGSLKSSLQLSNKKSKEIEKKKNRKNSFYLVQRISSACRAAYHQSIAPLQAAQVLRSLTAADFELCKLMEQKNLNWLVLYFFALPVVLGGFFGRDFASNIVIALPSMSFTSFILMNYYLLQTSVGILIAFYVIILFIAWNNYRVIKPANRHARMITHTSHLHHLDIYLKQLKEHLRGHTKIHALHYHHEKYQRSSWKSPFFFKLIEQL
jgi:ABC-type multidrug transport system fused ATPase/permease subunit